MPLLTVCSHFPSHLIHLQAFDDCFVLRTHMSGSSQNVSLEFQTYRFRCLRDTFPGVCHQNHKLNPTRHFLLRIRSSSCGPSLGEGPAAIRHPSLTLGIILDLCFPPALTPTSSPSPSLLDSTAGISILRASVPFHLSIFLVPAPSLGAWKSPPLQVCRLCNAFSTLQGGLSKMQPWPCLLF